MVADKNVHILWKIDKGILFYFAFWFCTGNVGLDQMLVVELCWHLAVIKNGRKLA